MKDLMARLSMGTGTASAIMRVAVGVLLAWHGYRKFANGLEGFEGFLASLELPVPGLLAVAVALLELLGGIALVLGLLTRPVAALLVIQFALIIVWVKLVKLDPVLLVGGDSVGLELDLLYLVTAGYFLSAGPGPVSADAMLGLEPSAGAVERVPATV